VASVHASKFKEYLGRFGLPQVAVGHRVMLCQRLRLLGREPCLKRYVDLPQEEEHGCPVPVPALQYAATMTGNRRAARAMASKMIPPLSELTDVRALRLRTKRPMRTVYELMCPVTVPPRTDSDGSEGW
jgi:hypothetical protein